jgi:3-dehydroquinate dehydratase-2
MPTVSLVRPGDRAWRLGLVNGPNMSNIGRRNPEEYGGLTIEQLEQHVRDVASGLGVVLASTVCSNHEGDLLDWIHAESQGLDGIVINPAGLTPYGEATRHALEDTGLPVVEVHFANIAMRGRTSVFTPSVVGTCMGLHKHSYTAALVGMTCMLDDGDFLAPVRSASRRQG